MFFSWVTLLSLAQAAPATVTYRDMAMWKVGQEIYFHSDLLLMVRELKRYQCLNEENKLLGLLNFGPSTLVDLELALKSIPLNPEAHFRFKDWPAIKKGGAHEEKMHSLLLLLMLGDYTQSQKVVVNSQVTKLLEKAAVVNGCGGEKKLGKMIEKFLRVEVFLRSRFHRDTFWVTPEELAAAKKNEDKKVLEIEIKEKKAQEALNVFLDSLFKQISHEVY